MVFTSSLFESPAILIAHLKNGDKKAYVQLVNTYYKLLFNYALSLTNDHAMAQDIVQDVFLYIWRDKKKLNVEYSLKNYIYKITYNKFINQYNKDRAVSSLERAYMETLNETVDDSNADLLERKIAIVAKGITHLPTKCKEAFLLSKKEGLTNIEIAEYMNISIKTVEGHLTKAYNLLKECVGNQLKNIFFLLFGIWVF